MRSPAAARPVRVEWRGDETEPRSMSVCFPQALTEEQMRRAAGIVCYWARDSRVTRQMRVDEGDRVDGRGVGYWRWTSPRVLWLELRLKQEVVLVSDGEHLERLQQMLVEGTPPRKRAHGPDKPVGGRLLDGVCAPSGLVVNERRPPEGKRYFLPGGGGTAADVPDMGSTLLAPRRIVERDAARVPLPEADLALKRE